MNAEERRKEAEWCAEGRKTVVTYLHRELPAFGEVGAWPAWHVAPYVSVWAVESVVRPGHVGWWVIHGDLPTDYVSSQGNPTPREAVATIAERWRRLAALMEAGQTHPDMSVGSHANARELAPLLKKRSATLADWARDDSNWEPCAR